MHLREALAWLPLAPAMQLALCLVPQYASWETLCIFVACVCLKNKCQSLQGESEGRYTGALCVCLLLADVQHGFKILLVWHLC